MTDVSITASCMLRDLGSPRRSDETVGAVIRRVARMLGWDYGRTKRLWYGEAVPKVTEWERVKAAVAAKAGRDLGEAARMIAEVEANEVIPALGAGEVRSVLLSLGRAAIALAERIEGEKQ